jgi:hypothetical protein
MDDKQTTENETMTTTKTTQYETLNDSPLMPKAPVGEAPVQVWYMNPRHFRDGISGGKPNPLKLAETHIQLGETALPEGDIVGALDIIWANLQGERWSEGGEARNLIRSKGLEHTSMSVGDCFRIDGVVWIVASTGFEIVAPEISDTASHLANVLEWAAGNRGSKSGNPYSIPEIKQALKHLAELTGRSDYLDVPTRTLAENVREKS